MAQRLFCFLSLIKTLYSIFLYIYIIFAYSIFLSKYRWREKTQTERKRGERTKLCELFGLCLRWRAKKGEGGRKRTGNGHSHIN